MKLSIIHTCSRQQPAAAAIAKQIHQSFQEEEATINCANETSPDGHDLVLAVFSLRPGAFAPIVPLYREFRDLKIAFIAILNGPVDQDRARKTFWAIKKVFCGNCVLGGYMAPADDENAAGGLSAAERVKVLNFARKFRDENIIAEESGLVVNY